MNLQAIIFDFDGTIIETEGPDYQTWQEIFVEHGGELPQAEWASYIGTSAGTFDPYQRLEQQIGRPVDRTALRAQRRSRFRELVAAQPLRPGVERTIAAAQAAQIPLAIASSSTRDWVEENLAMRKLRHHFEVVHTVNDASRGKPDPELYTMTVAALGVDATAVIAIEDSYNGMLAAKRAGIRCVVAPNALLRAHAFAEADLVVDSLAALPFAELCQLCD